MFDAFAKGHTKVDCGLVVSKNSSTAVLAVWERLDQRDASKAATRTCLGFARDTHWQYQKPMVPSGCMLGVPITSPRTAPLPLGIASLLEGRLATPAESLALDLDLGSFTRFRRRSQPTPMYPIGWEGEQISCCQTLLLSDSTHRTTSM
jgi:hypothetical protein